MFVARWALIVGLTMMNGETGICSYIQSFPLATLPRQNFSARNICCLFVRLNCGSDDFQSKFPPAFLLNVIALQKKLMIDLLDGSQVLREVQLYDTRRQQHFFLSCDKMIAEKRAVVRRPMVTVDSGRSCERNIFPDGT